jgi:hypothetical protein
MKKNSLYLFFLILIFFAACSNKIKPTDIHGQWMTTNNPVRDSKIIFYIADSTMLSEFYFHDGIKKVQFKYKIKEIKDNIFILETTNPFGKIEEDSIVYMDSLIKISTEETKSLYLMKIK